MSESEEELLKKQELVEKKKAALELLSRFQNEGLVAIRKQIEAFDPNENPTHRQRALLNRFGGIGLLTREIWKVSKEEES